MDLESIVIDHIEGKRKNRFFLFLLTLLSFGFQAGVKLRNLYYDKFFFSCRPPAKIISVGNIVAGGTGKTPMVQYLVERISGKKIAILTRGYRSSVEKSGKVVCLTGEETDARKYGDEPLVLMKNLPKAQIWVGKNRVESARLAISHGSEVLILEDGMQYRPLHRDFEIVMMNPKDLFGKGHFLPRGYLREDPKRLERADAIVLVPVMDEAIFQRAEEELKKWTKAPIFGARMTPKNLNLQETKVGVFCGLANPERFLEMLTFEKMIIVDQLLSKDHVLPSKEKLQAFADQCKEKGASCLLCTEKDKVKIDFTLSLPIHVVEAQLSITQGKGKFDIIVEQFISGQ